MANTLLRLALAAVAAFVLFSWLFILMTVLLTVETVSSDGAAFVVASVLTAVPLAIAYLTHRRWGWWPARLTF